ncbi:MAG: Hpt domain-containing protein [Alphaproteobacteria bacterium]
MNKTIEQVIDTKYLKSIIDDDKEFEKELFLIFFENSQRNIVKLEEAVASQDKNSWYMAAHAFKGASASIGAFELAKVLENAQKSLDADDNLKSALIAKIKEELEAVKYFIDKGI